MVSGQTAALQISATIMLADRPLRVLFSTAAQKRLNGLTDKLDIEMELYFSCLIRKKVYFRIPPREKIFARVFLNQDISISFRPVMTEYCLVEDIDIEPDVVEFPLSRHRGFIPKWLSVDYKKGQWQGQFGYGPV